MEYSSVTTRDDLPPLFGDRKAQKPVEVPSGTQQQTITTTVRGKLDFLVLDKRTDGFLVAYRFPAVQTGYSTDGREDRDRSKMLKEVLGNEILADVDTFGRVKNVRFPHNSDPFSRTVIKVLLSLLQFSPPASSQERAGRWEATEADPSGLYVAEYRLAVDESLDAMASRKGSVSFRKRKLKYLPKAVKRSATHAEISPSFRPSGVTSVVFDFRKGCIESLLGKETLEAFLGGSRLARSNTVVGFQLEKRMSLPKAEFEMRRESAFKIGQSYIVEKIDEMSGKREAEIAMSRQTLGGTTADMLLTRLHKLEENGPGKSEETSLFLKLRALASLDTEGCRKIGDVVFAGPARSVSFRLVAGSFAASGSEAAQETMARAIRARRSDFEVLFILITALAQVDNPKPASIETVGRIAFDPSSRGKESSLALLAYGAMASNLADSEPTISEKMVNKLLAGLEAAPNTDEVQSFVDALGNTGSEKALPKLVGMASDARPDVRRTAVMAMRLIESIDADQALFQSLTTDPESSVRKAAANSLGFRDMTSSRFDVQEAAFAKEKEASVRIILLNNLWSAREDFPLVTQIVEKAAKNDPSPDIREYAARLLEKPVVRP